MALKEYEKQALLNIATFNRKPYKESTQEKLIYTELEKKIKICKSLELWH